MLSLVSIFEGYPELQELNRSSSDSVREHAVAISSAAKEIRVAALQAQTEPARILLDKVAAQFEALVANL